MATVWYSWNTTSSTCSDSSTFTYDPAWSSWCSSTTYSTTSADATWYYWNVSYTSDTTWTTWVDPVDGQHARIIQSNGIPFGRQETDEEREERLERERQRQERLEKVREERRRAEEKAKQLLLDLIGDDQLKVYEETGRVMVKGKKYDYIIPKSGFIKRVEKDKVQDICVHLKDRDRYPETDNVIAMMLALKTNEAEVNELANLHGSRAKTDEVMESLRAAVGM